MEQEGGGTKGRDPSQKRKKKAPKGGKPRPNWKWVTWGGDHRKVNPLTRTKKKTGRERGFRGRIENQFGCQSHLKRGGCRPQLFFR